MQNAEQNLNYVLLLKNLLDVIPELGKILLNGESDFFCKIQKVRCKRSIKIFTLSMLTRHNTDPFVNIFTVYFLEIGN